LSVFPPAAAQTGGKVTPVKPSAAIKAGRSVLGPDGKVMAHGTTDVLVPGNVK
jgi:hypothetical protein